MGLGHHLGMPRPRPLPDSLTSEAFTYQDAIEQGVSRNRLRGTDIAHPHRGLYVPTGLEDSFELRCRNLVPLLGDDQWFSHMTAARLWGFPLPIMWDAAEQMHVLTMANAAPIRRPEVIGWETVRSDIPRTIHDGLPLVAPADVWGQLAVRGATGVDLEGNKRNLNNDWLVAVGDYVLTGPSVNGRRTPLCTREEMLEVLRRRKGKRGGRLLREAFEQVRSPVHSPKETMLRLAMVEFGLPEPDVQVPVMTAAGVRHSDLGYPAAKLLFEYQGDYHRTDRKQWLEDLTRTQLFEDAGYRVMLVGADDVTPRNVAALITRIRRALRGQHFSP